MKRISENKLKEISGGNKQKDAACAFATGFFIVVSFASLGVGIVGSLGTAYICS